eukprot:4903011-Pyramimonas_sp.AAC.1
MSAGSSGSAGETIISALRARASFLDAQSSAGVDVGVWRARQVKALISVILSTTGLTIDMGTDVCSEINIGPWSGAGKVELCTAVDEAISSPGAASGSRDQQHCDYLESYLTPSDWAVVTDTSKSEAPKLI